MDAEKQEAAPAAEGACAPARFAVTIAETGETFLNNADATILESMRRLGRKGIPVGCRAGGCSVCKVEILDGAWRQCRPMSREYVSDADLAAGRVLACCIAPTESVTLRVLGKMKKAVTGPCANQSRI